MDIIVSIISMIVFSPLFLIVGIFIWVHDRGPIIYSQIRIGKDGRHFKFYKFRSMPIGTPTVPSSSIDQITITPAGKIIRRTSIDELIQLYNILEVIMSFVGPRPSLTTQFQLIKLREENGSIKLKPGLTGWAQVNAYNYMPIEIKAKYDREYMEKITFLFDLKILFKTAYYIMNNPPVY